MKTDGKQCLSMKTVLTVGRTQMTSGHATVCMAKAEKTCTKVDGLETEDGDLIDNSATRR